MSEFNANRTMAKLTSMEHVGDAWIAKYLSAGDDRKGLTLVDEPETLAKVEGNDPYNRRGNEL